MPNAQAESHKNAGNAALAKNDFPTAIREYSEAIKLDPSNHIYFSNRALAYTNSMLIDDAITDAKKVIELDPSFSKGYSRLGVAYTRQGDLSNAYKAYQAGLKVCPNDTALLSGIEYIRNQAAQQNPFASLFGPNLPDRLRADVRTAALMNDPSFVAIVNDLVSHPESLTKYQDNPHLSTILQVAISGVSSDAPTPAPSASPAASSTPASASSSSSSSSSTSTPAADKMQVEEPSQPEPEEDEDPEEKERKEKKKQAQQAKEEGNALYKALKFAEAIAAYNKAIELDPTDMAFYTNRAAVNFQTGDYEQCIKDCEEGIAVGREHHASFGLVARAFSRIGNAYYKLDNLDAALEAFRSSQTEERSRETAKMINKLEQERARRAEQAYINPELAKEAKERGNAFFKAQQYPDALREYNDAIKRNPTDPLLYTNRALTYQKLWEFQKSIEDCDKALELDPNCAKAYTRKGQALFIKQDYPKALDVYRAGLAIKPDDPELTAGLAKVVATINQQHTTGTVDPERAKRAMADPEIQAILRDPEVSIVLQRAQTDPQALQRAMADVKIRHKIEKLVAAGIL